MIANTDLQFLGRAGINYLQSPGAETGVPGWSLFTTTWSSDVPTTISAGATNCSLTFSQISPLRGSFSLQFSVNTAVGSAGQGFISDVFTIDNADLAKVLAAAFDYNFSVNGSNVNVSGTSTQTLELWVYNVGLAAWTQPAGYRGINQNSGPGYVAATFQTDSSNASNKNKYRFAVIIKNAPAAAFTMQIDQATVGPQTVQYGAPVTDWQAFTPTGGWTTNTTYTGKWRRVGDTFEAVGRVLLSGPPNAATLTINLPFGLNIDTAKLGSTVGGANDLGVATGEDATVRNYQKFAVDYNGSATSVRLVATSVSGSNLAGGPVTNTVPFGWDVNDNIYFRFQVPILGWSSTVQMSNDTDTRVVAASYITLPSTTITSGTAVRGTSKQYDTHEAYNTTTGQYTAPVAGKYRVGMTRTYTATAANWSIYVNGISRIANVGNTFNSGFRAAFWGEVDCNGGDTITWVPDASVTAGATDAAFSFSRISGPSAIAATETVAAAYVCAAGKSIAPTNIETMYGFNNLTKVKDTHGAFNTATATFTAPVSGTYRVSGSMTTPSGAFIYRLGFGVNSTTAFTVFSDLFVNTSIQTSLACSYQVSLNAGQTVTFGGSSSSAAAQTWGAADGRVGWFTIERVGN